MCSLSHSLLHLLLLFFFFLLLPISSCFFLFFFFFLLLPSSSSFSFCLLLFVFLPQAGATALYLASSAGLTEAVRILLEASAQPNIAKNVRASCCPAVAVLLLSSSSSSSSSSGLIVQNGWTPLMPAAKNGYLPIATMLLNAGANVNASSNVRHKKVPIAGL